MIGFFLLTLSFMNFSNPQNEKDFIYVAFSDTKRLSLLEDKVTELIQGIDGEILFFMSNDNKPIVITEKDAVSNALDQMYNLRPSLPDFVEEIDSINSLFSAHNFITGLNDQEVNNGGQVNFHFFLNLEKAQLYRQDTKFIDQLLLTNRILFKNKNRVPANIKVNIYIDLDGVDENSNSFISQLEKKGYYEVYTY